MAPLLVLVAASIAFWLAGRLGVTAFQHSSTVLRTALALMFLLTASAHWGKRRPDLIRMVPPRFPRPDLLVTISGMLEIAGAIGLVIPSTAPSAAICLALLLVALFPANVHAAREIDDRGTACSRDNASNGDTDGLCRGLGERRCA